MGIKVPAGSTAGESRIIAHVTLGAFSCGFRQIVLNLYSPQYRLLSPALLSVAQPVKQELAAEECSLHQALQASAGSG